MSNSLKTMIKIAMGAIFLNAMMTMVSTAQTARISEEIRTLQTYPFSKPNPIPILTRDARLYPYHSFEGYTNTPRPHDWKVIKLENDLIEVFVLPEAGGKVWGAIVKKTGHEFIYRNEVMKFRNIALRGPWTSGGIEFNFGIIGHTPSTASPVDYTMCENEDGSVSAIVGSMDLPSRTHWRVEIRLFADKAYFETNVLWNNPTNLEQPYYNWMTGAAFAQDDLVMSIPGKSSLTHPGEETPWPIDADKRNLAEYTNNQFGGHKSYHVVGEMNDFFGGYYKNEDYGFGQWSRHEEMPGQKLWLWALSREGGIWDDLLTDTDGQYIEFQAGRMLNQYQPGDHINPITKSSFNPGSQDRWTETWFPLEGIGGLTDASRDGAMYVKHENGTLTVNINAFSNIDDILSVYSGDKVVAEVAIDFTALEAKNHTFELNDNAEYRVVLPALDLDYSSNPKTHELTRPYSADESARPQIPQADIDAFEGRELLKERLYNPAEKLFAKALTAEPWHHDALLGMADLKYRSAQYEEALTYVNKVLKLDSYDATANFLSGNINRAMGQINNARDAYGWAARSMNYRSAANVELAEIMMGMNNHSEATRYARIALDYDRYNLSALEILAMIARKKNNQNMIDKVSKRILQIDPLHYSVNAETYLANPVQENADKFLAGLRNEYPDQIILELAIDYVHRGAVEDATRLLSLKDTPLLRATRGRFSDDAILVERPANLDFVFPYRPETLGTLNWVTSQNDHWSWAYLRALNLWALDRSDEALDVLNGLKNKPDFAPLYVVRASLKEQKGQNPAKDYERASKLDPDNNIILLELVTFYQRENRWQDAAKLTAKARTGQPDDFNTDLLHVKSLNNLGQVNEAIAILNNIHVLPSENARDSHMMYEQAHTIAAMDAIDAKDFDGAIDHLNAAKQWPEHLGQGKPYEPEERLQNYLIAFANVKLGNKNENVSLAMNKLKTSNPDLNDKNLIGEIIQRALALK